MISYALQHMSEVLLLVDKDNYRSRKAIEKLNFIQAHQMTIDRSFNRRQNDVIYRIHGIQTNA